MHGNEQHIQDNQLVLWQCRVCSRRARVPVDTPRIFCACGYQQLNGVTPGLGDKVAAVLHKVGVTPQRYVAVKGALGLQKKCRCPERQEKLNNLFRDNK